LGNFSSGWQRDLTVALKELKNVAGDNRGCTMDRRETKEN